MSSNINPNPRRREIAVHDRNFIQRYWDSAGTVQRVVLLGWFVAVLVSNVVAGWGLLLGGAAAFVSTAIIAAIWSGVSRVVAASASAERQRASR